MVLGHPCMLNLFRLYGTVSLGRDLTELLVSLKKKHTLSEYLVRSTPSVETKSSSESLGPKKVEHRDGRGPRNSSKDTSFD